MGLRFHAPQSFLFIANYGWSLVRAPTEIAAAIVANGAFVAFFGWPLKRISGAMAGAALGLMMAGCYARIAHEAFVPWNIGGGIAGTMLGFALPRTFLGFALGTALGLAVRAIFIAFGLGEYALEAFAGGVLVSYVLSLLAPEFWIVTMTAMVGSAVAFLAVLPLARVAPERIDGMRIALAAAWAVTFMVAMAVQIRLGPLQLHIPRAFNKKKKKA